MKRTNVIVSLLVSGLLAAPALVAGAADKPSDTVINLGVGARAVGMGGAFTAIVKDATASFWNPAGMEQNDVELTIMYKTLPLSDLTLTGIDEFNPEKLESGADTRNGTVGMVFFSVNYPMNKLFPKLCGSNNKDVASFSFTRGGYYNETLVATNLVTGNIHNPEKLTTLRNYVSKRRVVTDYYTLAYEHDLSVSSNQIKSGVGLIYATQRYEYTADGTIQIWDPTLEEFGAAEPYSEQPWNEVGKGIGGIIGFQGDIPMGEMQKPLKWGLAYRTQINLDSDNPFSSTVPGRLSAGVAYDVMPNTTLAVDVHHYFKADRGGASDTWLEDNRKAVTNYAVGLEHVLFATRSALIPVRFGVASNNSANDRYRSETLFNVGVGYLTRDIEVELTASNNDEWDSTLIMFSISMRPFPSK